MEASKRRKDVIYPTRQSGTKLKRERSDGYLVIASKVTEVGEWKSEIA